MPVKTEKKAATTSKVKKTSKSKKMAAAIDKEILKRRYALTALLNDREYEAVQKYCNRYKIQNKSKMMRDMIFSSIFKDYMADYPTLFDKQVMADLVVERR